MAPKIEYQVSPHQKLAVFWPFSALNPCQHHHNGIRAVQKTYHSKALMSTIISAPILGRLQWKMFALYLFQRCGQLVLLFEWSLSLGTICMKLKPNQITIVKKTNNFAVCLANKTAFYHLMELKEFCKPQRAIMGSKMVSNILV